MHRVPDKNPGSDSDTVCLKRDRVRTCHESDPIYIVSCSDTSCWLPEESRDRVGRSLEPDPTRTSSHPDLAHCMLWIRSTRFVCMFRLQCLCSKVVVSGNGNGLDDAVEMLGDSRNSSRWCVDILLPECG